MKRKALWLILCLTLIAIFAIGLTGCNYDGEHVHRWEKTLSWDEETHWYVCVGCDERSNDAPHSYQDGVCACGRAKLQYKWEHTLNGYMVAGIGEVSVTDFAISTEYNRQPVKAIGESAFLRCSSLKSIVIPDSIISIGNNAFQECRSLTSIAIPKSVTTISFSAFYDCSGLESIQVDSQNPVYKSENNCLLTKDGKTLLLGCKNSIIPNGVTRIGDYSPFAGCRDLTRIEIPNSVTSIGNGSFFNCSSLTSIKIPDSVTSIGDSAFNGCLSLTSIEIPNGLTSIGNTVFYNCSSLKSIVIPSGITSIGHDMCAYCSSLESIEIPNGLTRIGDCAFYNCGSLTSIEIPRGVTSIGYNSFFGCDNLEAVYISDIAKWCEIAFESTMYSERRYANPLTYAHKLYLNGELVTDLVIPEGGTSIGKCAFVSLHSLTSIELPNGVTNIDENAFYDCSSLTRIVIPNSVTSVDDRAFIGCWKIVHVRNLSNQNLNINHPDMEILTDEVGEFENRLEMDEHGIQTYTVGDKKYLFGYIGTEADLDLTDYTDITDIYDHAFNNCRNLTSITIPNNVTSISGSAFVGCFKIVHVRNLSNQRLHINNPDIEIITDEESEFENRLEMDEYGIQTYTVGDKKYLIGYIGTETDLDLSGYTDITDIYDNAFSNCRSLTSIAIPNSVTNIGNCAFEGCCNLTSIDLSNSATNIGNYMFSRCCNLTSIKIPNSLISIGDWAFYNCIKLTRIDFKGTMEEWQNISKNSHWDTQTLIYTVYCEDGTINQ